MMRLAHPAFGFTIPFHENEVPVLVLEQPRLYRHLVKDLLRQMQGERGEFVLSKEWTPLAMDKHLMAVTDALTLDLNERKLITGLHKEAVALAHAQDLCQSTANMKAGLSDWLAQIEMAMVYPVCFDMEVDTIALLKAANFHFHEGSGDFVDRLDKFLCVYAAMTKVELIVFVNLHSLLAQEELDLLYRAVHYRKMQVLMLEPRLPQYTHACERQFVVDKDLCELYPDEVM